MVNACGGKPPMQAASSDQRCSEQICHFWLILLLSSQDSSFEVMLHEVLQDIFQGTGQRLIFNMPRTHLEHWLIPNNTLRIKLDFPF